MLLRFLFYSTRIKAHVHYRTCSEFVSRFFFLDRYHFDFLPLLCGAPMPSGSNPESHSTPPVKANYVPAPLNLFPVEADFYVKVAFPLS